MDTDKDKGKDRGMDTNMDTNMEMDGSDTSGKFVQKGMTTYRNLLRGAKYLKPQGSLLRAVLSYLSEIC